MLLMRGLEHDRFVNTSDNFRLSKLLPHRHTWLSLRCLEYIKCGQTSDCSKVAREAVNALCSEPHKASDSCWLLAHWHTRVPMPFLERVKTSDCSICWRSGTKRHLLANQYNRPGSKIWTHFCSIRFHDDQIWHHG